jgi:hypothetical protein
MADAAMLGPLSIGVSSALLAAVRTRGVQDDTSPHLHMVTITRSVW